MTNLAAAALAPGCWPRATKHACRRANFHVARKLEATPFRPSRARAIPCSRYANFLEFPTSGFHYSVIGPWEAARQAANRTFNLARAHSNSAQAVPLRMHKEMIDDLSIKPCQFRLRTGDRTINANGFANGGPDFGQSHVDAVLLMRLAENIHAKPPSYATIAPISHIQHVTPAQRGITLSTGAADASGR